MSILHYCRTCFYPHTKPDLMFNENGVCSACEAFGARKSINWLERNHQFLDVVDKIKYEMTGEKYNCIVPVSGGKDSHFQVIKLLEYGLNPLLVCAETDYLSHIGSQNLKNIARLADLNIVVYNRQLRHKINKLTLETIGDISWAEHVSIFTAPFNVAAEYNIPYIFWGENPQNEYGGPKAAQQVEYLDYSWLQEFGGMCGLRVSDVEDFLGENLDEYRLKMPIDFKSIFMGYFFEWNGFANANLAKEHGFKCYDAPVEGSGVNYENLDNYQTGIHDYFKYLKFGFGRATDLANNQLRRGMMTRSQAKTHILNYDGAYPFTYLGKPLPKILEHIDMTDKEFRECVIKFANKELFNIEHYPPRPKFIGDLADA